MNSRSVYVLGPTASGKSTVSPKLALLLAMPYLDLDSTIEARIGCSIAHYWKRYGENRFRAQETHVLKNIAHPAVIATGAGIIERRENTAILRTTGIVVFLDACLSQQVKRLSHTNLRKRPALQSTLKIHKMQQLIQMKMRRRPRYQALATIRVSATQLHSEEVRNHYTAALARRILAIMSVL